jgi:hypothetical protein
MPCELSALQMLWWSTIAGGSRGLPRRSTPATSAAPIYSRLGSCCSAAE